MRTRDEITPEQVRRIVEDAMRPSKYGSRRTYVPELERWFASQREADAAVGLWRRQQAGEVRNLSFQPRFPLEVDGELICTYVADFLYDERRPQWDTAMGPAWVTVVADAKGMVTPVYKLKKTLMRVIAGIEIVEL